MQIYAVGVSNNKISMDITDFSSLTRRAVRYIFRGNILGGFPIFATENLSWPGFVEFDDVNSKVVTFSDATK